MTTKYTSSADIVDAIFGLRSDIRELEASLARQIIGSAISTPEYGQNPWDTKPVVDAYHRRCFEKTIARLEATWSSGDLAISEDQSAGKHHANSSCGPVAGADVGLCCVDMATTSREAVASGECPTVDVVHSPSTLPCMAFASGIAVRGRDGFSSPDPTALSLNSTSTLPPVWKASSTPTVPPLWTAPPVQLASPEHTDLTIDQQTDRTQTTTLDNQLQDRHVQVMAAQLERHYPPAKAAPPERRTAPTDPRMHDASQKKGYGLVQDASQKTRPRVQEVLPKTGYLLVRGASTAWYPPVQGAPMKKAAEDRVSEGAESTTEDRGSVGAGYTADRATTVDGSVTDMGPVGTPDGQIIRRHGQGIRRHHRQRTRRNHRQKTRRHGHGIHRHRQGIRRYHRQRIHRHHRQRTRQHHGQKTRQHGQGNRNMDRGSADTNDQGPAGTTHGIQTECVKCSTVWPKFAAEGAEARTVYDEQ